MSWVPGRLLSILREHVLLLLIFFAVIFLYNTCSTSHFAVGCFSKSNAEDIKRIFVKLISQYLIKCQTNLVDGGEDRGVPCLWVSHGEDNLEARGIDLVKELLKVLSFWPPLHLDKPSWVACSAWRRGNQLRKHSFVRRRTFSTLQEGSTKCLDYWVSDQKNELAVILFLWNNLTSSLNARIQISMSSCFPPKTFIMW